MQWLMNNAILHLMTVTSVTETQLYHSCLSVYTPNKVMPSNVCDGNEFQIVVCNFVVS